MKVLSLIAFATLGTNSAMAVETAMDLKGRFDYVRTENNNKTTSVKTNSGELKTSFLRLASDTKVNDTVSVKLTLDFTPVDSSSARSDTGVSQLVNEAVLTKNFGSGILAKIGKQALMTGGRENDYSTRDLYFTSEFKRVTPENLTGLSLGYSMNGQGLYLQYLEQKDADSTPFTDKKVVGAAYYGSFMDSMISPIISYHKMGTSRVGAYNNAMSLGLRLAPMKELLIEADWLQMEQEKNGTVTGVTAADAKLTSVVTQIRYVHENFQPFFKYIMDKGSKGYNGIPGASTGAEKSKRDAWELGLEYVPAKDEDMRYHVVYNNSTAQKESPAPSNKVEEKKIYAGIAFGYNILK